MWSITHKFKDSYEKGRPHISLNPKKNEGDIPQKKHTSLHQLIFKSYSNHRKAKLVQVNALSPSSANFAVQGYNISAQLHSPTKTNDLKKQSATTLDNFKLHLPSNEEENTKSKEPSSEMSTSLLSNLVLQKLLKNKTTSEEPKKVTPAAVVVHEEDELEDYTESLRPSRLGMRAPDDNPQQIKLDSEKINSVNNSILRNSAIQDNRPTTCGEATKIPQNKPFNHMKRPMTSRERPQISRDRDGWGEKPKTNEQSSSLSVWEKRRRLTLQSLNTSFQSSYLQEERQSYSKPQTYENSPATKDSQSFHKQYYYETNAPVWQPTRRFPMNMPIKTKKCRLKKDNFIENVISEQKIITCNQNKNQIGALTFYAQPQSISPRGANNNNNNRSINQGIPFIQGLNGVKYRSYSTRNSIPSTSKALYSQNLELQNEESEGMSEQIKSFLKFTCRDRLSPALNNQSEHLSQYAETLQSLNHKNEGYSPSSKSSSMPKNIHLGQSTLSSPLSSYLIKNDHKQSTLSSSIAVDLQKESANQPKEPKNNIFNFTQNKKSPSEILTKQNISPSKKINLSTPQKVSKNYHRIQDKYPLRIQSAHYASSSEHTNCFPQPARINPHVLFQQASSGSKEFKPSNSLTISNSQTSQTSPPQIKKFEFIQVRF